MSPIAVERPRLARPPLAAEPVERPPAPHRATGGYRESAVLLVAAYCVYAAVGLYATLGLDVVVGDAEARLAHAYFVWWNDPSKLTAIGFYWPPLQTLVLLPLAAIKPLAVSLAALPLTSALFAAGTLVVLDRALVISGVDRALRWALLAAVGLNPIFVFYAGNGMAESLYLFLLAAGVYLFVRWAIRPRWHDPLIAGFAFGLGILSRYEVGLWLPLVVIGTIALLVRRRAPLFAVEATLIALLAVALYGLLLWTYLNLSITSDPLGWFTALFPRQEAVRAAGFDAGSAVVEVLRLHAGLFPPALALAALLLAVAVRRRSPVAAVLATALLVDVAATLFFLARAGGDPSFLQLRYNIRAIPLFVIALGWLLVQVSPGRRRMLGLGALVLLVATIPATAATMWTSPYTLGEGAFLRGLVRAESQDAVAPPTGTGTPVAATREMARDIVRVVHGTNAILTDDAHTYGVILATGRPDLFLDRVDVSDRRWRVVLADPVGRVRYLLVDRRSTHADLVVAAYPGLRTGADLPGFADLVFSNEAFALYRVSGPT